MAPSTKLALLQGFARGMKGSYRLSSNQELPLESTKPPGNWAHRAAQAGAELPGNLRKQTASQLSPGGERQHLTH